MNLEKFYPEYESYIIELLSKNKANRVNGSKKFVEFILEKFEANELETEYDKYDTIELTEEITQSDSILLKWFKDESTEVVIISRNSWTLKSLYAAPVSNLAINIDTTLTSSEITLINTDFGPIHAGKSNDLKVALNKLESLDNKDSSSEAKCAFLIAESGYQQKNDELNANDWSIAGQKSQNINHNVQAKIYFIRAGKLYSQCYMYKEAAEHFKKAIALTNYKKNDDSNEKNEYKKLLVDCRLQYERSGQNQEAAEIFIIENDISTDESRWYIKPLMKLFKYTALYGESPSRVAVTALLVTVISIAIYYICGISDGEKNITGELGTSTYFAIVTFTTLGYGDYSPEGFVRVVATLQAFLGLLLTSLFMVTLVRKFSR